MDYLGFSFNIVDRFLAATDELLDFTRVEDDQGVETEHLVRVLKKYCPDKWHIEEDSDEYE
jgi:hypothetical protein